MHLWIKKGGKRRKEGLTRSTLLLLYCVTSRLQSFIKKKKSLALLLLTISSFYFLISSPFLPNYRARVAFFFFPTLSLTVFCPYLHIRKSRWKGGLRRVTELWNFYVSYKRTRWWATFSLSCFYYLFFFFLTAVLYHQSFVSPLFVCVYMRGHH